MRAAVVFAVLLAARCALAQQTIFNVPTTDVLDRGKVYAELDVSFKFDRQSAASRFSSFVPRVVAGAGGNVEIGLNVLGNVQPGPDATTLSPTVKWKFFENKNKTVVLAAGTNFYIPVRNRGYRFGTYSYLTGSTTIGPARVTAGAYVASKGVFAPRAVRAGIQSGVEYAVNEKFSIAADWISGRHASGYFTPGLIFKPRAKVTAYLSYSIGNANASRGNRFFLFEVGYNFN